MLVQPLGVLEVQAHGLREGLVAFGDHVPQVANRDQLPEFQVCAAVHQQLHHQLQRGALSLQGGRHGNQRLHQGRCERVDLAEHLAVRLCGQQRVKHIAPQAQHIVKGGGQRLAGVIAHGPQHTLLGDGGQVAVFQRDAVKPGFPVFEHIAELNADSAAQVLAHQVAQVPLPCHEADQRNRPVGVCGLHQLDQLGALSADEGHVTRAAGQPQHQLVQKQDDGVVAQVTRMPAHDGQAGVQRYKRLACTGQRLEGGEELADQSAHELAAFNALRRLQHGGLEADGIPATLHVAPTTAALAARSRRGLVQLGEEGCIAHLLPQRARIVEQLFCQVKAGHGCFRTDAPHVLCIAAQDGRFHVGRADHVVGHHQEALALRPAGLLHRRGQFGHGPRLVVAGQQQVQHCHEVALA